MVYVHVYVNVYVDVDIDVDVDVDVEVDGDVDVDVDGDVEVEGEGERAVSGVRTVLPRERAGVIAPFQYGRQRSTWVRGGRGCEGEGVRA